MPYIRLKVKKLAAALAGDIIISSAFTAEKRRQLPQALTSAFDKVSSLIPGFRAEQFEENSFQAIVSPRPELALKALMLLQAILCQESFGVRIALGIGDIGFADESILTSDGSASQLSQTALNRLKKKNQLAAVISHSDSFNKEWQVHALSLSYLLQRWTTLQAEAVQAQLEGLTQEDTAKMLGIKQPAVQQRLHATGWTVMDAILERFQYLPAN